MAKSKGGEAEPAPRRTGGLARSRGLNGARARTSTAEGAARARAARAAARALSASGVEAVALGMVDNAGVTRVKCIPLGRLEEVTVSGVGLSYVFSVFEVDDQITSAPGLDGPSGDMRLLPDPASCVALAAQPGWAWAPVDQYDQDGNVWPVCGRSFLSRMTAELGRRQLEFRGAFEVEWFLGRREEPDPVPSHRGPGYSSVVLTPYSEFAVDLIHALEAEGLGVQQFHPEYSIGQFEVSVAPRDAVGAADANLLVRQTIRGVAHRHGLDASFAPVVFPGAVGNGAHLHFSLWDADGDDVFHGGDGPLGMSRLGESFLAGVLAELPALTAVVCPSVVSYLRLQPHRWAGAFTCWGPENREAALRFITGMVGGREITTNVELKSIDAAGNPYLVVGAVLAAGVWGIDQGLSLPPPVTADPASLTDDERRSLGIERLPASLGEAIDRLEKSSVLRDAMGDTMFDAFLATRRAEFETFRDQDEEAQVRAHRWRY